MVMVTTRKQLPLVWWGALSALLAALVVTLPVQAAGPSNPPLLPDAQREMGRMLQVQGPRQIFRDDLKVDEGQVIEDDVMVYSGDVDVEDGGRITGNLIVFSGDVTIDEDSVVEGNVTNYSGDINVAGHVGGNLSAMSGDVTLDSRARVDGDISVVSGSLRRDEGATVGGNVVQGPTFGFSRPTPPNAPDMPGMRFETRPGGFFASFFNFIGRVLAAALMTALAMLLVGGLFYLRPQIIADTRKQLHTQLALSAVVGVLANLVVLFLAGLMAITICLLPIALIPLLALLAVNVVGWAVISQIVGEKIVTVAKQEIQPALTILVGAFFLTGALALLWTLGGCFQFIASLLIFAAASLGTGATLLPWINRRRGLGGTSDSNTGGGGDIPPGGPMPSGPTPAGASRGYDAPVETDVAAPVDYVTAEEINAGSGAQARSDSPTSTRAASSAETGAREVVEHNVAEPLDYYTAKEINATQEQTARKPASTRTSGAQTTPATQQTPTPDTDEETVEQDVAAPVDYVTAQEVNTTEVVTEDDDFLQIKGIGPTYARRLKDAGFLRYAQLAAATPEELAEAIGWPADRVRRAELIDQAKLLAQQ